MESATYTINGKQFELQHHGVKGMKWGVRRYQKKDGSLTSAGKKRYDNDSDGNDGKKPTSKKVAKAVAAAVVMGATVTAAAVIYKKNPEAIKSVIAKAGKFTADKANKAKEAGKKYLKEAYDSAKQGVQDGIKKAPGKAAEAIVTGATLMAAKRLLDKAVGKEESARIFQANNNKKIGSFWKVSPEDKNDDD